jgi:hypothetical protein
MSRIAFLLALSFLPSSALAEEPVTELALMDRYFALTSVNPNCRKSVPRDMILVCGRRNADRYRVPLVIPANGDPQHEGVASERHRLQHLTSNCDEKRPFQTGCGMVGVTATVGLGGGSGGVKYRKLAP